jgi:ribonucleoside-diphosphate reductase alpha chain
MDYVFRRLALDYLDFETRSYIGIYTAEERARQLETGSYAPVASESDEDIEDEIESYSQSAPVERKAAAEPVAKPAEGVAKPAEPQGTAKGGAAGEVKSGTGAAGARQVSAEVHSSAELMEKFMGTAADAPICMTCGTKMRPAGSCYVCEGCGSTSGCS